MPKHAFLSEKWINEARKIRDKHLSEVTAPPAIRMNLVVTGVPFGDDPLHAHIDTTSGSLDLDHGHLDRPDVTVSTDYATSRALFVGQDGAAAMLAFMEGRIRVQGDLAKLMALQMGTPSDASAQAVSEAIRDITAD
jgi:putative sterol carrier protein